RRTFDRAPCRHAPSWAHLGRSGSRKRRVFLVHSAEGANVKHFDVRAIGRVESQLTEVAAAPRQADEGALTAWLIFDADMAGALANLRAGDEILLLTWLDRARRDVLSVQPRGEAQRAKEGVFSTRSPHRPNPIGLHRVAIVAVDGIRIQVRALEAVNGTPIIDV